MTSRAPILFCMAALLAFCATARGESTQIPHVKAIFVEHGIGIPPDAFDFWQTGGGPDGKWAVMRDSDTSSGAAVEQFSLDRSESRCPIAICRPVSARNVVAGARIKLLEGTMLSAGIAVRVVSADSYYVAAASALEGRVDLFRFTDGRRERLSGVEIDIARGRWHSISLAANGNRFTVSFDGVHLFNAWDQRPAVDGHVTLWTEEDNVTRFDAITITTIGD